MSILDEWDRTDLNNIKTGDVLFFSNNSPTGLLLKTFTSTLWTHTGIAVRLRYSKRQKRNVVSVTGRGKLYVMEINSRPRHDYFTETEKRGFGFTEIDLVLRTQVIAAVRPMRDKYRVPELVRYTEKFARKHGKSTYICGIAPLLNVWLGYPFTGVGMRSNACKGDSNTSCQSNTSCSRQGSSIEFFCSEMMTYYYLSILPVIMMVDHSKRRRRQLDNSIGLILGPKSPALPELVAPRHFDVEYSPDAPIFEPSMLLIHRRIDKTGKVLIIPLLTTLTCATLLWIMLPGNSWKETHDASLE